MQRGDRVYSNVRRMMIEKAVSLCCNQDFRGEISEANREIDAIDEGKRSLNGSGFAEWLISPPCHW
jgi:hypothetical protein